MQVRTSTHLVESENCSVVQIDSDNDVTLFGKKLHNIRETLVDYYNDRALFFYKDKNNPHSLNQDPSASVKDFTPVYLPLNLAFEIFAAFKTVEDNERKQIDELFERIKSKQK